MKYLLPIGLLLLACGGQQQKPVVKEEPEVKKIPYMHITVKDYGDIVVKLYRDDVPNNVKSVVDLTNNSFYNGLKFHRIIKGFVIQGGCPQGDGTGGPGYELNDEIVGNLKHLKGTVAMANSGPNTNGSQFYICLAPQPGLDGRFTIIGEVVEGLDVVDKIGSVKTSGPPADKPLKDVVMEKVWIEEIPAQ